MREFVRSFFGFVGWSGDRTVAGNAAAIPQKDIYYIRQSNARLKLIHDLCGRYKATMHAPKLQAVYDKTKAIHTYLVARQRVHELELFHVQHTDHFISTFTAIADMHRHREAEAPVPPPPREERKRIHVPPPPPRETLSETIFKRIEAEAESIRKRLEAEAARNNGRIPTIPEMVKRAVRPEPFRPAAATAVEQEVSLPAIAVDTYAKLFYTRERTANGILSGEISYTSPEQDKAAFLASVATRLGVPQRSLSYMGNALLDLPGNNGTRQTGYAPILHWNGFPYALHLTDFRLFPVRMHRRSY